MPPFSLPVIPLPEVRATLQNLSAGADAAAHRQRFPCKSGCSTCCLRAVPVSEPEARLIHRALLDLPARIRSMVHDSLDRWIEATRVPHPESGDRVRLEATDAYRAAQVIGTPGLMRLAQGLPVTPCPFLVPSGDAAPDRAHRTGTCAIYADRPAECRMHAVMGPNEACRGGALADVAILDARPARTKLAQGGYAATDLLPVALARAMRIEGAVS